MKIRILSDLHIDVNDLYPFQLQDNDAFTVIAGDIAGSNNTTIQWVQKNIKKGLIISGNHIVYSADQRPIQELKQQLADAFPPQGPVTYLDQMTHTMAKQIDNILFIGTTLYTDYALLPTVSIDTAMWYANSPRFGLNDFRFGHTRDGDKIRRIHPTDYRRWFIESKKEITRLVQSNPDKEIVLITHHCPSNKCCSCKDEILITSYASNLESFIRDNPNIKLWITGHVHDRKNFKIGNCLVVMNPRGYEHRGETLGFNPNTFVDTKDWSVRQTPTPNKRLSFKDEIAMLLKKYGAFCYD